MKNRNRRTGDGMKPLLALLIFCVVGFSPFSSQACIPLPPDDSALAGPVAGWTRPMQPSVLSVSESTTDTTGSVNLIWTDNSLKENGFNVERALYPHGPWSVVAQVAAAPVSGGRLSYHDRGLSLGIPYNYRVNSQVGESVSSLYSNVASVTIQNTLLTVLSQVLGNPNLSYSTSGSAGWQGQSQDSIDQAGCAQSGRIGNNQTSVLEFSMSGPGTLAFWWKVSSEQGHDFLCFYIDGQLMKRISGEVPWTYETFALSSGTHNIKFSYIKDGATASGNDCGCVDDIKFYGPATPTPIPTPLPAPVPSPTPSPTLPPSWGPGADAIWELHADNGSPVAWLDGTGNLSIIGNLSQNQGSIAVSSSAQQWYIKNNISTNILALIPLEGATTGDLKIRGNLFQSSSAVSADHMLCFRNGATVIASMDDIGNLYLANSLLTKRLTGLQVVSNAENSTSALDLSWDPYSNATIDIERSFATPDSYELISQNNQSNVINGKVHYVDQLPHTGHYYYRIRAHGTGFKTGFSYADAWTWPENPGYFVGAGRTAKSITLFWFWEPNAQMCVLKRNSTELARFYDRQTLSYTAGGLTADQAYSVSLHFENPGDAAYGPYKQSQSITVTSSTLNATHLTINHPQTTTGSSVDAEIKVNGTPITSFPFTMNNCDHFDQVTIFGSDDSNTGDALAKWKLDTVDYPAYPNEPFMVNMDADHTITPIYDGFIGRTVIPRDLSSDFQYDIIDSIFSSPILDGLGDLSSIIRVYGSQTGHIPGGYEKYGADALKTVRFTPDHAFRSGEEISISVLNTVGVDGKALKGALGTVKPQLKRTFVWRGYAKSGVADDPTVYGEKLTFGESGMNVSSVAVGDLRRDGTLLAVVGIRDGATIAEEHSRFGLRSYTLEDACCTAEDLDDGLPTITKTSAVAIADIGKSSENNNPGSTKDNLVDIVVANDGGPLYAYLARKIEPSTIRYYRLTFGPADGHAHALAIGDIDGDGYNEILVGYKDQAGKIFHAQINGSGAVTSFSSDSSDTFGDGTRDIRALQLADFDLDGDLDIAAGYWGGRGEIFINDGLGHFAQSLKFSDKSTQASSLAVGDFNGDSFPDIAMGNFNQPNEIWINKKDLTFASCAPIESDGTPAQGSSTTSIVAGDFDGDGWLDLAVGNSSQASNPIYLNQGAAGKPGELKQCSWIGIDGSVREDTQAIAAGDFDNDGDLDFVVANKAEKGAIYLREPSLFTPVGSDSFSVLYDWAYGVNLKQLGSLPLLAQPSLTQSAGAMYDFSATSSNPRVATDDNGHWVAVWSTNAKLQYKTHGERHGTDYKSYSDPQLNDFSSQNKHNIVFSRFWDKGGNYDSANPDPWNPVQVDEDTLWSPPVPISPSQASVGAADYTWADIATNKQGTWAVVWTDSTIYDYPEDEQYGEIVRPVGATLDSDGNYVYPEGKLYLSLSTDNAKTWLAAPIRIDGRLDSINPLTGTGPFKPTIVYGGQFTDSTGTYDDWMVGFSVEKSGFPEKYSEVYVNEIKYYPSLSLGPNNPKQIRNRLCETGGILHAAWDNSFRLDYPHNNLEWRMPAIGLDLATDGHGNWVVVWVNKRYGWGYDILEDTCLEFSFFNKGIGFWSLPRAITPMPFDAFTWDDPPPPFGYANFDLNPVVEYGNGKWMVFWETGHRDVWRNLNLSFENKSDANCVFNYDLCDKPLTWPPANPEDGGGYIGKGLDKDIAFTSTNLNALNDHYKNTGSGYSWDATTPWDQPKILNKDALLDNELGYFGKKDITPEVIYSTYTDPIREEDQHIWLVAWKTHLYTEGIAGENEQRTIQYAISRDGGVTWDNSPDNKILGDVLPFERKGFPALAADAKGKFMAVFKCWNDIVSACSPGLVEPGRAKKFVPEPTPTPKPIAINIDSQTVNSVEMRPLYNNHYVPNASGNFLANIKNLPNNNFGNYIKATTIAGLGESDSPQYWTTPDSSSALVNQANVVIFNMPVLKNGIQSINQVRYVDYVFKANRTISTTPADFELWVFKGGRYTGSNWNDVGAWELAGSWSGVTDFSQEFHCRFAGDRFAYINSLLQDGANGFGGVYVRPAGTTTFAICSRQKDAGAALQFDYVKINVYPLYLAGNFDPVLIPGIRQISTAPLNGDLTFYAEIDGSQLPTPNNGLGKIAAGRLTLHTSSTPGNNTLEGYIEIPYTPLGMSITDVQAMHVFVNGADWGAFTSVDSSSGNATLTRAAASIDAAFEEVLYNELVYIEIKKLNGSTWDLIARGKLYKDTDGDGLSDVEENNLSKLFTTASANTDPNDRDSDEDGLFDGEEILKIGKMDGKYDKTDPQKLDSDDDEMADGLEVGLSYADYLSRKLGPPNTKTIYIRNFAPSYPAPSIYGWTPDSVADNIPMKDGMRLVDADTE